MGLLEFAVWVFSFAVVSCSIILFRLLLAQTYIIPLAQMLDEYGISPDEFTTHFENGIYQADLFNLLDWTGTARARFIADKLYYRINGSDQ